jgi:hypothetical protein
VSDDDSVKQTVAFRIVRQSTDHVYGSDEKISPEEFLSIYRMFSGAGGSWEGLVKGDMKSVTLLEGALDRLIRWRNTMRMAARVVRAYDAQYRST